MREDLVAALRDLENRGTVPVDREIKVGALTWTVRVGFYLNDGGRIRFVPRTAVVAGLALVAGFAAGWLRATRA